MCNCLFGFSLEGVNVVLQMLDLLCKLKNDVMGLQVCSFELPLPPLNFAKEKMTKKTSITYRSLLSVFLSSMRFTVMKAD